ncbi:MAG: peptidyl-prolyl cis-trans isomerase [Candidatus Cloacimonetes bacterium]|nr:peptidyl-prolyl cis-trans isomerase [Candidatus Cloacimonadota bacterium]
MKSKNYLLTTMLILTFFQFNLFLFASENSTEYLVEIGNSGITREDLDTRLSKIPQMYRSQYQTMESQIKLLENMAIEEAFYLKALEMKIEDRPLIQEIIQNTVIPYYAQEYLKREVTDKAAISEKELSDYYNENKEKFRVKSSTDIKYLRISDEGLVDTIIQEYADNNDFDALVEKYSNHASSKNKKGEIRNIKGEGYIPLIGKDPELEKRILEADVAIFNGPITTESGIHFFIVTQLKPEYIRPLDEIREEITASLLPQKEKELNDKKQAELKEKYNVVFDNELLVSVNFDDSLSYIDIMDKHIINSKSPVLKLTVADYIDFLSQITSQQAAGLKNPDNNTQYWQSVIDNRLLYIDSQTKKYKSEIDNMFEVKHARKSVLIRTAYKETVIDLIEITDDDVNNYYNENLEKYETKTERSVQLFAFETEKIAKRSLKAAAKALKKNNFDELDKIITESALPNYKSTIDKVFNNGVIPGIGKDDELSQIIWNTEVGNLSEITRNTKNEFVFVRILSETPGSHIPLSEVKNSILDIVKREKQKEAFEQKKEELFAEYKITIFSERLKTSLSAEELFELAEESQLKKRFKNAVDYYNQIIDVYKNNKDDYKALFMKAFIYAEELNNPDEAVTLFQQVLQFPTGDLHESAEYMIKLVTEGEENILISE